MPVAPQPVPPESAGQAGGILRAPSAPVVLHGGPRGTQLGRCGQQAPQDKGSLGPVEWVSPTHSAENRKRGSLGVHLASAHSTVACQGKFLPSRMRQRPCHGPVLPETPTPVPASAMEQGRVTANVPQDWPHPQPCWGGFPHALSADIPGEQISCLSFIPLFTAELSPVG